MTTFELGLLLLISSFSLSLPPHIPYLTMNTIVAISLLHIRASGGGRGTEAESHRELVLISVPPVYRAERCVKNSGVALKRKLERASRPGCSNSGCCHTTVTGQITHGCAGPLLLGSRAVSLGLAFGLNPPECSIGLRRFMQLALESILLPAANQYVVNRLLQGIVQ
jgi:hypothetical protein